MPRRKKIFYGWWMVLAHATLNVFAGGTFVYGFTTFFNPIRNTFGWTAAVTSIAFVLQRLEWGIMGPIAGFLVDRIGTRKLMLPGWALAGLGFILMSRIDSLWGFYGTFVILATGMSFAHFLVPNTAIANWFVKKRSRAMTFVYVGMGLSGSVVPLLALSIVQFGWRETLIFVGIGCFVVGLPLSLVIRHKPEQYGYLPDGETREENGNAVNMPGFSPSSEMAKQDSVYSAQDFTAKEAIMTRAFWLLSLVFFFQHIGTSAVMVHIVPYLESVDVPTQLAASAVAGVTVCSLIGRLGFGILGDFTSKRYLMSIAFAFQTIGILLLSIVSMDRVWFLIPFLLTYAPGYGGPIPLRLALQADYFGRRSYGTIAGLMSAVSMLGGLASPVIAGWIFDVTGSYRLAWQLFAMVTLPAVPLMLLAKPPKAKQEPQI